MHDPCTYLFIKVLIPGLFGSRSLDMVEARFPCEAFIGRRSSTRAHPGKLRRLRCLQCDYQRNCVERQRDLRPGEIMDVDPAAISFETNK